MGFYQRRILPTFLDKMTNRPEVNALRQEHLASARARVLEIGFGSGLHACWFHDARRSRGSLTAAGASEVEQRQIGLKPEHDLRYGLVA
jgi:Protein of unknown function (DUF938)